MSKTIFPELRWAQRSNESDLSKNIIWITICVPDLANFDVNTTDTKFKFTGKDANRDYFVEFDLFEEIDSSLTKEFPTSQHIVVELHKKQAKAEYWPRLTKDSARKPYIKTDFDKWVDEDEQDPKEENPYGNFDMSSMLGGAGAGADGAGGFDMSQLGDLSQFQQSANDDSSDEENDETVSNLGEAK